MGDYLGSSEMSFSFPEPLFSALRAGVLSSCFAKKKVAKEEGDPEGDAGFAGPLRYSSGRAACQNSPTAQTRQADCPRPACVAQRLPRGPEKRPCPTVRAEKRGSHGQPEKTAKKEIQSCSVDASPGPLRGAEQRRSWRKRGEDCLRAQPRVPQPPGVSSSTGNRLSRHRPRVAFFLLTFSWRSKKSKPPRKGGTPCLLASRKPSQEKATCLMP